MAEAAFEQGAAFDGIGDVSKSAACAAACLDGRRRVNRAVGESTAFQAMLAHASRAAQFGAGQGPARYTSERAHMAIERTLSIIKPDATRRNLTGKINAKFEEAGLRIVAQKRIHLTLAQAQKFYEVHKERAFFGELTEFMASEPVVVQVLEGEGAIAKNREVMGATNPANAADGTIRKEFALSVGENSVHGSDAPETGRAWRSRTSSRASNWSADAGSGFLTALDHPKKIKGRFQIGAALFARPAAFNRRTACEGLLFHRPGNRSRADLEGPSRSHSNR